jgi:hypothetical protein
MFELDAGRLLLVVDHVQHYCVNAILIAESHDGPIQCVTHYEGVITMPLNLFDISLFVSHVPARLGT